MNYAFHGIPYPIYYDHMIFLSSQELTVRLMITLPVNSLAGYDIMALTGRSLHWQELAHFELETTITQLKAELRDVALFDSPLVMQIAATGRIREISAT
jgi:hypothetical protein